MARSKRQPICGMLIPWLRENLGRDTLGALTGADHLALAAAHHIIALYATGNDPAVLDAFRIVVLRMQPSTRHFAFHAIAHVMDWSDRPVVWSLAGLPELSRDATGVWGLERVS